MTTLLLVVPRTIIIIIILLWFKCSSYPLSLLFNIYPVRSPILRHSARTNSAALHARMEPGTAQIADNRPGRKGQLWATTKAEEGTCPSRLNWFDVPDAMMQKQQCWPFGFRESLSRRSWIPKETKLNLRGDRRIWSEESRRRRINKYFICFLSLLHRLELKFPCCYLLFIRMIWMMPELFPIYFATAFESI